tara:strand:+ start:1568 stop:2218 length:651 start_codon:yes stop_codon:yes gene_type:complete
MMSEIFTRTITGAILVAVVITATSYNLFTSISLWLVLAILGIRELKSNSMGGFLGVFYLLMAASSVVCLGFFDYDGLEFSINTSVYRGMNGVALLCVIWANDTSAYLGGIALGKKIFPMGLAPHISPKKSWEGAIIGALVSGVIGFLVLDSVGAVLGFCVGILAILSDLIESKAKRKAGIKDSGTLLPGHGGVLDRFDALLLSAPFTLLTLYLLSI